MKKQDIVNLVRYHVERNEGAFIAQVAEISREFAKSGDDMLAQHLMELVSDANVYVPQNSYKNLRFLEKKEYSSNPLLLPDIVEEDVMGIVHAINNRMGMSTFLFGGAPGSGKTETAFQIARLLQRDILMVHMEELVDSHLGETGKNVAKLFDDIRHLSAERVVVIFDELDAIVLDRINHNDLREMGRVTSIFLRELDALTNQIVLIATTNLLDQLDKALIRRFDAVVSFDRYSREDLMQIADKILEVSLKQSDRTGQDMRLFNKILNNLEAIPYPGDMKQIIRSSIAFSNPDDKYDYLRKIYLKLNDEKSSVDIQRLQELGYTTREIEILSRIPKSSVSRKLKEVKRE